MYPTAATPGTAPSDSPRQDTPAQVCLAANLHRLFGHTRSTGITLDRRIKVSVFGVTEPKTNRGLPCSSECHTI